MQKVKKAVIPVAGYGTRFLPFTKAVPKAMLPVVNKPAIQLIIEEAANSGIEEILLVVGQHKEIIEQHFLPYRDLEEHLEKTKATELLNQVKALENIAKIKYIVQEKQLGTAHAVLSAREFVGDEPFAVMFGDDLMCSDKKPVLKQLIDAFYQDGKTVIGVKNVGYENVSKYASVEYDGVSGSLYHVTAITEKPERDKAKSDLAPLGRYVLRGGFLDVLSKVKPGYGGEYQLTDGLGLEINEAGLNAYAFKGKRYDMGDVFGFLQANCEYALRDEKLSEKMRAYLLDTAKKL